MVLARYALFLWLNILQFMYEPSIQTNFCKVQISHLVVIVSLLYKCFQIILLSCIIFVINLQIIPCGSRNFMRRRKDPQQLTQSFLALLWNDFINGNHYYLKIKMKKVKVNKISQLKPSFKLRSFYAKIFYSLRSKSWLEIILNDRFKLCPLACVK